MQRRDPELRLSDWGALRLQVLRVYEGPPRTRHRRGPDAVETTQAWLLQRGRVRVATRGGAAAARAGQWLFTTSRKLRQDFSGNAMILSLNLRAGWPDDRPLFRHDPPTVLEAAAHPQLERAARAVIRLRLNSVGHSGEHGEAGATPATLEQFMRFHAGLQRLMAAYVAAMRQAGVPVEPPGGADARVVEAIRVLDHQPPHVPFDEGRLCEHVGLSRSQLHRLFVRHVGITALAYHDRRRLDLAQRLLAASDTPVKAIAFTLGFKQPSHFTRWFAQRSGLPPRQYRQRHGTR